MLSANLHINHSCFLPEGEKRLVVEMRSASGVYFVCCSGLVIFCPTEETAKTLAKALQDCIDVTLENSHGRKDDALVVPNIPL